MIARRTFIGTLAGSLLVAPLAVEAQRARQVRIGFFGTSTAAAWSEFATTFVRRLHELGWIDGQTAIIAYRWADGRSERFPAIAAEFVRLDVDVIVTSGAAVLATRQATSAIPIVFALANDPVGTGLVPSLARPGGNVTGLSLQAPELVGKRLGLLREVLPHLHRLALFANIRYSGAQAEMREAEAAAKTLGVDVIRLAIHRAEDVESAFDGINRRADAMYVCTDPLANTNRVRINRLALAARLPTLHSERQYVEAGGLMSYGPDVPDLFRRAAEYVDKILRGARPGDLPVEQPTKFELIVNVKTAKALGLTIPQSLLLRADQVIE